MKDWRSFRAIYREMPKWPLRLLHRASLRTSILDERGIEVHLAHPVYVKPFAKKHVKTDKVDSEIP